MSNRTVIVGGGVIGTACAYYLADAGHEVTILDQGRHGGGCSHANCGYVSPSHVPPLAKPGVVGQTLRSMLSSDSPFYIKPRLSPSLMKWLLRFLANCTQKQMEQGAIARHALLSTSRQLYEDLIEREQLACEFEKRGLMFVYLDHHHFDAFQSTNEWLTREFGVTAVPYAQGDLQALEPALKPEVAGAWHYTGDAHLRPDRLMSSWRQVIERMGVKIIENQQVTQFRGEGGKLRSVSTKDNQYEADQFIIATGAWTPMLNKQLGVNIPIQPGKGYSITMPRPENCPKIPMLLEQHRVGVTPFGSGYRLGSTMEFAGYDTSINNKRLQLLKRGAEVYLHTPHAEPEQEQWYGWRPMTPDGVALIDFLPRYANTLLCAGHNMLGLSMAPGTGLLVRQILCREEPHIDPARYRLKR
ncbi:MAG: FAD-dependent oxidoreductase [Pirellulaceae bacterium]